MKYLGMSHRLGLLAAVGCIALAPTGARAQEQGGDQWAKWWYGVYGGVNYNLFSGEIHSLDANNPLVAGTDGFNKGNGIGAALGGMIEYNPGGLLGFNIMLGYDNRAVKFDAQPGPSATGSSNEQLSTGLAYFALEPNVRINLGNRFFHALLGVDFDINVAKGYTYTFDSSGATRTRSADMANPRSFVIGGHAGLGYDIPLAGPNANTQILLTPFAQFHLGQDLLDVPSGSSNKFGLSSIRAGVQLKFGSRPTTAVPPTEIPTTAADFTVRSPEVVTESRRLNETFPVRNYIFFDAGSTEIPSRYKRLSSGDASSFKEEQLLTPTAQTGNSGDAMEVRSRRQMEVYYQVINIFGDRLRRNPTATIRLIGSANGDGAAGKTMAENVKKYLVGTFGIDASRITTEGRDLPAHKSGDVRSRGEDKKLIDAENYRVEIVSNPPELLSPVNIVSVQEEPIDNDIVFTVPTRDDMALWNLEITERGGATRTFGPYKNQNVARVDSKLLLGGRRESRYTSRVLVTGKDGKVDTTGEKEFRLVRADASEEQTGTRYSILFEFDDSKTVQTYEQFLVQTVAPNIPTGSSVIIHGHTDVTGDPEYNAKLSQRRAEEAQKILTRELTKAGKTVTFDTYGFGEDERRAPFNNTLPEQRYYNRTVVVEVVPAH